MAKKGVLNKLAGAIDLGNKEVSEEKKETPKKVEKKQNFQKEVKRGKGEALESFRARIRAKQEKARSAKLKSPFQ